MSAKAKRDGRVEVRPGDVPDRVDHRHDHEPEADRDADVAEPLRLGVDHDRAAAGEDERERADRLGRRAARSERRVAGQLSVGKRARAISRWTRASISSRIRRTASRSWPAGIVELPVLVLLAGIDRAGVAAAHRDHDVGGAHDLVGERLRELLAHVDAELLHRLDTAGLISSAGAMPAERTWMRPSRAQLDEPGGHLAAAGVVDADEQHLGLLLRRSSPSACASAFSRSRAKRCASTGTKTLIRELAEQVDATR